MIPATNPITVAPAPKVFDRWAVTNFIAEETAQGVVRVVCTLTRIRYLNEDGAQYERSSDPAHRVKLSISNVYQPAVEGEEALTEEQKQAGWIVYPADVRNQVMQAVGTLVGGVVVFGQFKGVL
jgi:hypothetical protein